MSRPSLRTNRTRLIPPSVLIGHSHPSFRTNRARLVPPSVLTGQVQAFRDSQDDAAPDGPPAAVPPHPRPNRAPPAPRSRFARDAPRDVIASRRAPPVPARRRCPPTRTRRRPAVPAWQRGLPRVRRAPCADRRPPPGLSGGVAAGDSPLPLLAERSGRPPLGAAYSGVAPRGRVLQPPRASPLPRRPGRLKPRGTGS